MVKTRLPTFPCQVSKLLLHPGPLKEILPGATKTITGLPAQGRGF